MKAVFVAIFTLFILIFISACLAIPKFNWEDWGNTELFKIADKFQGIYVFDKKLRDEMIQRKKKGYC